MKKIKTNPKIKAVPLIPPLSFLKTHWTIINTDQDTIEDVGELFTGQEQDVKLQRSCSISEVFQRRLSLQKIQPKLNSTQTQPKLIKEDPT